MLASKLEPVSEPRKTHGEGLEQYKTVREFIEGYPKLKTGSVYEKDLVHVTAKMNALNINRIQNTPEGGDRRDWPEKLINKCHKNYKGHTVTYGRMSWDALGQENKQENKGHGK